MIDLKNVMIVLLKDDGISLQIGSDSASYSHSGKIRSYAGFGEKVLPSSVVVKDQRKFRNLPKPNPFNCGFLRCFAPFPCYDVSTCKWWGQGYEKVRDFIANFYSFCFFQCFCQMGDQFRR